MPNLSIFAKALFGENSHLLDWRPQHSDWVTDQAKHADGFVWLPWRSQLWVVEVEWKEGSNFFQQSRAFSKSRVSWEKLSHELRRCLYDFEPTLNRAVPNFRDGHMVDQIISQTKENHYEGGYLKPHCWVLLGHDGKNSKTLHDTYEEELDSRFKGPQQYLLTMARMFQGETARYALLTQYPSCGCSGFLNVERSVLVPVRLDLSPQYRPVASETVQSVNSMREESNGRSFMNGSRSPVGGRAAAVLSCLTTLTPNLQAGKVKLRIELSESASHDFEINWDYPGKELMVFSKSRVQKKPSDAAKEVLGRMLPPKISNIARKYGIFVDVSGAQVRKIMRYADVERHLRQVSARTPPHVDRPLADGREEVCTYFDSIDAYKQRRISKNILKRKALWSEFISKREMTSAEFKQLSRFEPKAIAGFMRFLTCNKIASRFGESFTLDAAAATRIERLLDL